MASLDRWDDYTAAKEAMFQLTDTAWAPWTVIKSNDKKRAPIGAMRYVLGRFDYTDQDPGIVGKPIPSSSAPPPRSTSTARRREGLGVPFPLPAQALRPGTEQALGHNRAAPDPKPLSPKPLDLKLF